MSISLKGTATLLQVFDMPESLRFYRDKLGFRILEQAPNQTDDCDWVLLSLDDVQLMLNTAYEKPDRPAAPDPVRMASHSDVEIYFGAPDVQAVYNHLVEQGLTVKEPKITGYGFKAVTIQDPDGFILCFHWPNS